MRIFFNMLHQAIFQTQQKRVISQFLIVALPLTPWRPEVPSGQGLEQGRDQGRGEEEKSAVTS